MRFRNTFVFASLVRSVFKTSGSLLRLLSGGDYDRKVMEYPQKMLVWLVVPIALAGFAFGGPPVATVSSSGTFDLHGTAVRTEGIPSWPVLAGDEIATHASSALIRFQDGTSVALAENSRAKVETVDNAPVFRLLGGAMQVTATQSPAVKFYNGAQPVPVRAGVNPRVGNGARLNLVTLPPPPKVSGK
jgi:hypothetical protein